VLLYTSAVRRERVESRERLEISASSRKAGGTFPSSPQSALVESGKEISIVTGWLCGVCSTESVSTTEVRRKLHGAGLVSLFCSVPCLFSRGRGRFLEHRTSSRRSFVAFFPHYSSPTLATPSPFPHIKHSSNAIDRAPREEGDGRTSLRRRRCTRSRRSERRCHRC
jgi:hypothetical protein